MVNKFSLFIALKLLCNSIIFIAKKNYLGVVTTATHEFKFMHKMYSFFL